MSERTGENFEGWAILELMGHRRLAGYLREQQVGGAAFVRIDVPNGCSGVSATWCPEHGDCKCPAPEVEREDPACPLHNLQSTHGEGWAATQMYAPAAVYCITPTTEAIARKVAASARPAPVTEWELKPERTLPAPVPRREAWECDDCGTPIIPPMDTYTTADDVRLCRKCYEAVLAQAKGGQ